LPANLTPQYMAAEATYKEAKTAEEKRLALEEMLAVIPKHKGTEKLQAEIKSRLAKLRQSENAPAASKGLDPFHIPREGGGQAVLVGFPNAGKSALVSTLTRAKAEVGDYPFTTALPLAGMMPYEDIWIQLVDTPPITAEEMPVGFAGTLRAADALLLLLDLSSDECLDQLEGMLGLLRERHILREEDGEEALHTKTLADCLVIGNKADLKGSVERVSFLNETLPPGRRVLPVSAKTKEGLTVLSQSIFIMLGLVRVYGKAPGQEADHRTPFTLKKGSTIQDFAAAVHRDFPNRLKNARVWGSARFPGQSVQRDYVLIDKDIVELHV